MAGPNSAPNGDRSLVGTETVCAAHGSRDNQCTNRCIQIRLRDYLARSNRLRTGKTSGSKR